MPDLEKLKGKLSLYLSTLSDSAQNLLLRTLEKGQLEGTNDAASDLILAALKDVLQSGEELTEPEVFLETLVKEEFFRASEPFISEVDHIEKAEARISPSSVDAIWNWMKRDIATQQQANDFEIVCNNLEPQDVSKRVMAVKQELCASISQFLNKILREIGGEQKISNQLGGEKIFFDLKDVLASEERLAPLKPILARLPNEISSWSNPEGSEANAFVSRYIQQAPLKAAWAFSAVSGRLTSPRLKLQLATGLAGSDDAIQVAATVYAPAVVQILADMEAYLSLFKSHLHQHSEFEKSIKYLSKWRSLAKAMETELELPLQCPWGKAIAQMKTGLSEQLEIEIGQAAGLLRKALRAPKDSGHEAANPVLIEDAKRAISLFYQAERMKDSLALNGPITKIRKELDQSFEILSTSLLERTRLATGSDIEACKALGDAAASYAALLFDEDYAIAFRRQLKAAASVKELSAAEA